MTFDLLKEDGIECECISNAGLDETSTFLCSVGSNNPKSRDFLSKWERYKNSGKDLPFEGCGDLCALKGVSMNSLDGYDENEIIEVYKQRLIFSAKSKTFLFKFNISEAVGVAEHTPNDDHHIADSRTVYVIAAVVKPGFSVVPTNPVDGFLHRFLQGL